MSLCVKEESTQQFKMRTYFNFALLFFFWESGIPFSEMVIITMNFVLIALIAWKTKL